MTWTSEWTIETVEGNWKALGIVEPEDVIQLIQDAKRLREIEADYDSLRMKSMLEAEENHYRRRVHCLLHRVHYQTYLIGGQSFRHPDWSNGYSTVEYYEQSGDFIEGAVITWDGNEQFSFPIEAFYMQDSDAIAYCRAIVEQRIIRRLLAEKQLTETRREAKIVEMRAELARLEAGL